MEYTDRKKIETLNLFTDFKKASDSLSHKYIDECLEMLTLDSLFEGGSPSSSTIGGKWTKKILLEQEVPQVDEVSPYTLTLAVGVLLIRMTTPSI